MIRSEREHCLLSEVHHLSTCASPTCCDSPGYHFLTELNYHLPNTGDIFLPLPFPRILLSVPRKLQFYFESFFKGFLRRHLLCGASTPPLPTSVASAIRADVIVTHASADRANHGVGLEVLKT